MGAQALVQEALSYAYRLLLSRVIPFGTTEPPLFSVCCALLVVMRIRDFGRGLCCARTLGPPHRLCDLEFHCDHESVEDSHLRKA